VTARRSLAWIAGASLFLVRCSPEPEIERRVVTLHAPSACRVDASAYSFFYAAGDFQPTVDAPAYEGQFLSQAGVDLAKLPPSTRALVLDVSQGDLRWHGLGSLPERGPVDLLLWPDNGACALTGTTGARTGGVLAAIDEQHVLVTGGTNDAQTPRSVLLDLGTGAMAEVNASADLLLEREGPSVTAFAGGAIVAGGLGGGARAPSDTAERFVVGAGVDGTRIELGEPRAFHAAVTLGSGETLLVGGAGDAGGQLPLVTVEAIDPQARRSRTTGLAKLERGRIWPLAIRLASGEILVAGGAAALGGARVDTLEWLTPDGSARARRSRSLVMPAGSAIVALAGGGALAVLTRPPELDPAASFRNVWVISADGNPDPAVPIEGTIEEPRLFAGTDGGPVLFTGSRWLRWEPWLGAFEPMPDAQLVVGPARLSRDLSRDWNRPAFSTASPDGGLSLWLEEDGAVRGFRFSVRGPFTTEARARRLLTDDLHPFAPDRLVIPGETTAIRFDRRSGVTLDTGATIFLTDVTFARFSLSLTMDPARPPLVVVRDDAGKTFEIGGPQCPFTTAGSTLHIDRTATRASIRMDSGPTTSCDLPSSSRLGIGLRGGPATSTAKDLEILRVP
jgi:hypothetical protein